MIGGVLFGRFPESGFQRLNDVFVVHLAVTEAHRAVFYAALGFDDNAVALVIVDVRRIEIITFDVVFEFNSYDCRHLYFASNISNNIFSPTVSGAMLTSSIDLNALTRSIAIAAPPAVNPSPILFRS